MVHFEPAAPIRQLSGAVRWLATNINQTHVTMMIRIDVLLVFVVRPLSRTLLTCLRQHERHMDEMGQQNCDNHMLVERISNQPVKGRCA